jgi:saccharopine dehydrogenase-like NADP-dependent oxidoreductase
VLGAGAMGRITARDLVETAPRPATVVIADRDRRVAADVVDGLPRRRGITVAAARADAGRPGSIAALLRRVNAFAVVNATHHRFNLTVMAGALDARVHYCDLGGLFHQTRRQLRHHRAWQAADRLALLGIGAAPGIVNVLARSAADTMQRVEAIHIAVGGVDRTTGRPPSPFGLSYSIQTVLEEASVPAALFASGRLTFVPPMSGATAVRFPPPVGTQCPALTLHSEVATLPVTYRRTGIRECSFRIAFPADIVDKLEFLRSIGMLSTVPVGEGSSPPRAVLAAAIQRLPPPPAWNGVPDEYEILRVVVRGIRDRSRVEETIDCHTPGIRAWRLGIDVDTGCPPSIAMQMLARGEIAGRGCLPPEVAVPAAPFFAALRRRGMTIRRRRKSWS